MRNILAELQTWYLSNCDGEWEHGYGVSIDTLDNPGWSVRIDLLNTSLQAKGFERIDRHITENDWIVCWIEENEFHCACGPENLENCLQIFLDWSKSS